MRKLVLSIIALALSLGAFAQFRQIPGDPVDYSLIRLPRDAGSYPVTFTMSFEHHTSEDFFYDMMVYWMTGDKSQAEKDNIGWTDVVFTGELRHTRDISPELLERAIQEAFLKTGLNRPLLKKRMEQSKELRKIIYTNKEFLMDVAGAVMLAVPGLGELSAGAQLAINTAGVGLAVVSMAHDNTSEIANGVNSASATLSAAQAADNVLSILNKPNIFVDVNAKVASGVGIGVNAAAMAMSTYSAHKREVQKWKNREGASALWQINSFYNWVNYYLDLFSKQDAKDAWVLLINSTSESAPYMFQNTKCGVTWALDAKLVKCESMPRRPDRLNYGFEGKYCGMLEAVSIYDLSGYSKQFLTKWGNWADDYLVQGKGFKAHGMLGSGNSTLGSNEVLGDAMFHANWCYNDPMEEGARLYSWTASASMAGAYHIPVFFEIQLTGEAEGTFNNQFVHLMWMNQDEFDGVGIARSFGFSETNPDQMYKTALKMETKMDGLITPRMGEFPAHTIKISEVVDGDKYIYDKVEKEKEKSEVHKVIPLRNEHGFIDIALPEGEVKIDFGNVLAPSFETVPQDKKDWEKIKAKWF